MYRIRSLLTPFSIVHQSAKLILTDLRRHRTCNFDIEYICYRKPIEISSRLNIAKPYQAVDTPSTADALFAATSPKVKRPTTNSPSAMIPNSGCRMAMLLQAPKLICHPKFTIPRMVSERSFQLERWWRVCQLNESIRLCRCWYENEGLYAGYRLVHPISSHAYFFSHPPLFLLQFRITATTKVP